VAKRKENPFTSPDGIQTPAVQPSAQSLYWISYPGSEMTKKDNKTARMVGYLARYRFFFFFSKFFEWFQMWNNLTDSSCALLCSYFLHFVHSSTQKV
jgi:hypothetical protein